MQVLKPEVRIHILQAAKVLFFEQGYKNATMRQVAERVQMSVSNLYKYFRNKEDLFEAVVGSYASTFRSGYIKELKHREKSEFVQKRIESMVAGFSKTINADYKLFYILMNQSQGSPYENFKHDCAMILKNHMLESLPDKADTAFIIEVIVTNLFSAFASIAFRYGGNDMVTTQLLVLFRYHMAGYKAMID